MHSDKFLCSSHTSLSANWMYRSSDYSTQLLYVGLGSLIAEYQMITSVSMYAYFDLLICDAVEYVILRALDRLFPRNFMHATE